MGLYIKGMKMPEEGSLATIRIYPDGTCVVPNWHGDCAIIKLTKAVPVPHVVLCKDCKHKGWVQESEHGKSVDYCHLIERCVDKQFFCAAGEEREE